jgi:hypothetical protein
MTSAVRLQRGPTWLSVRVVLLIAAVLVAYHYSLVTLLRSLTLQTPLAYLALVPVIASLLAWVRIRREPVTRPIHDRQVDYIIGLAFLAVALAIALLIPLVLGPAFWLNRIDLVSLPFFVAGLVALLFGVRRLWTVRFPVFFLFLAWPVPYLPFVGAGLRWLAEASVAALSVISVVMPFADPAPNGSGLFIIHHGGDSFGLFVASECAGSCGLPLGSSSSGCSTSSASS